MTLNSWRAQPGTCDTKTTLNSAVQASRVVELSGDGDTFLLDAENGKVFYLFSKSATQDLVAATAADGYVPNGATIPIEIPQSHTHVTLWAASDAVIATYSEGS